MTGADRQVRLDGATLPGNLFLAPVAGYSDAAFRSICVELGADLCYTEMVSAEALTRGHLKTNFLLERAENESRYAIQLFGSKPDILARAVEKLLPLEPLVIDLNCGCPVPKIIKSGAGSALIRKPELLRSIVGAMSSASPIPVTVKIRLGWDEDSVNFLEVAQAAVAGGAKAVTLHARTRAQGYSGRADWSRIAELARDLRVPVFGSGDVFQAADVLKMLEATGCAGVMIARGALGNPFIFAEARALLDGAPMPVFDDARRADVARRHLGLSVRFLGERTACVEFRKQFCSYTKGMAGGAELRALAVKASNVAEFEVLFGRWAGGDLQGGGIPAEGTFI
jgi:nifR3 family TIM-barrel protein